MCRHAAWLGAPRPLAWLINEPEHGLLRQSYAPRRQRFGMVNADGFGMGWYDPARPEPVRYRRSVPIWTDANLPALAEVARSGCLLAAVRSATVGMPIEESATAPFADGGWLLSHNGRVSRDALRDLADDLPDRAESACDAAWVAAAVFLRGRAGAGLADALAEVVVRAGEKDPGARLNLLACDGASIAATVWGDTLFHRRLDDGVVVSSEPLDDLPGWQAVPERSLLTAGASGVRVQPLTNREVS
ncbi:ergothioneine biosynthesis protein EgtC [Nonomuraea aridisoli]|uniref:Gamma-glutamyl-hercynylcysteine sulfoxide hydrolase n=1 Tax=Nonomuraea aridisoli TaxID=2070368 RepID=A0A2W2E9L6_9ACTN|nr:ergothioneine biosynthesis protein EgtC [Nonomuraea aridisoli]PZG08658.1 ergothioneine biosynthesis protein EgtC [Nonomuraea aridisoli]